MRKWENWNGIWDWFLFFPNFFRSPCPWWRYRKLIVQWPGNSRVLRHQLEGIKAMVSVVPKSLSKELELKGSGAIHSLSFSFLRFPMGIKTKQNLLHKELETTSTKNPIITCKIAPSQLLSQEPEPRSVKFNLQGIWSAVWEHQKKMLHQIKGGNNLFLSGIPHRSGL